MTRIRSTDRVRRSRGLCLLGILVAADIAFAAPPAVAITDDAAAKQIAAEFGVIVLRVKSGSIDGIPVWLVTVMNRGGEFNSAFQVNTLAVDQATGRLVPSFRHRPSGQVRREGGAPGTRAEQRPEAPRSRPWR